MTRRRFEFIWCHFHPCFDESSNDDVDMDLKETDESQSLETSSKDDDDNDMERIQVDK